MKITVGITELNVLNCKEVFDYGVRDLVITVAQSEMDYDEIKTLFKENREADGDITVDRDGLSATYCGYSKSVKFSEDEASGVYCVTLASLPPLEKSVSELTSKLKAQESVINEKSAIIDEQTATIETILLEVIPSMMGETVVEE